MFGKTTLIAAAFLLLHLATASAQYCPGNPDGTSSFDWTAESWNVWIRPNGTLNPVLTNLKSPFHPGSSLAQPNTRHLETAVGMGDYRPEDGWVLIDELMGFSQNDNYTTIPFLNLYFTTASSQKCVILSIWQESRRQTMLRLWPISPEMELKLM